MTGLERNLLYMSNNLNQTPPKNTKNLKSEQSEPPNSGECSDNEKIVLVIIEAIIYFSVICLPGYLIGRSIDNLKVFYLLFTFGIIFTAHKIKKIRLAIKDRKTTIKKIPNKNKIKKRQEVTKCFYLGYSGRNNSELKQISNKILKDIITPVCKKLSIEIIKGDSFLQTNFSANSIFNYLDECDIIITYIANTDLYNFFQLGYRYARALPLICILTEKIDFLSTIDRIKLIYYDCSKNDIECCKEILYKTIAIEKYKDYSWIDGMVQQSDISCNISKIKKIISKNKGYIYILDIYLCNNSYRNISIYNILIQRWNGIMCEASRMSPGLIEKNIKEEKEIELPFILKSNSKRLIQLCFLDLGDILKLNTYEEVTLLIETGQQVIEKNFECPDVLYTTLT